MKEGIDPCKREVIVALEVSDYINSAKGKTQDNAILCIPFDAHKRPICKEFDWVKKNEFKIGKVYVQNPLNKDGYYPIETCKEDFVVERFQAYVHMCALLGAKSVKITNVSNEEKTSNTNAKVSGSSVLFKGECNVSKKSEEIRQKMMRYVNEFKGDNAIQLDKAEEYMKGHCLFNDSQIRGLYDLVRDGGKLQAQSLEISTKSSLKNSINIACKINIPFCCIDMSFSTDEELRKDLYTNFEAIFN